ETGRARIDVRVVRHDGPFRLQGTEIERVDRIMQLGARAVDVGAPVEEVGATNDVAVRRIEPDTDARHLQRARRRLGDGAQRVIEHAGVNGGQLGKLYQKLILTARAGLRLAQNRVVTRLGARAENVGFGHLDEVNITGGSRSTCLGRV